VIPANVKEEFLEPENSLTFLLFLDWINWVSLVVTNTFDQFQEIVKTLTVKNSLRHVSSEGIRKKKNLDPHLLLNPASSHRLS